MNLRTYLRLMTWPLRPQTLQRLITLVVMAGLALGPLGTAQATTPASVNVAPAEATLTNTLTLQVIDAVSPTTTLSTYNFLINVDNTGDTRDAEADCRPTLAPDPENASLADCDWPSIHKMAGDAPIATQGDQDDFNGVNHFGFNLPAGKYLISVVADGYKIGGAHFTMPLDVANGPVVVELEPNPLPTITFRAMVFNDNTSPNGAMDTPGENGLNGFEGHLADVLGEISTDWFGNPLCTEYERDETGAVILDGDGAPTPIAGTGGICLSGDSNHDGVLSAAENDPDQNPDYGQVVIPNLGTNRFAATAVPPNGSDWVQTTTLEGGHDWDTWIQEGATGYDTEFLNQNELFPWAYFGFVKPNFEQVDATSTAVVTTTYYAGEVKGTVWGVKIYVPPQGGLNINNIGIMGAKKDYAVDRPYIALSDLNDGDRMVYMGRGNPDGTFDIKNVPPSDYLVTVWDGPQNLILDILQVIVTDTTVYVGDTWPADNPNDPPVPGNVALAGWFTRFHGSVFIDTNGNGKRDAGEKGLPQQAIALKMRGNSLMQHGQTGALTDSNGYYDIRQAYPINVWVVMEVYSDLYYTTGITYQADNGPEKTVLGQGVDVNVLPIIGLSGRLDWGVRPYNAKAGVLELPYPAGNAKLQNGGIVGSISYDVTRNELDPRLAAAEDWQPGVPGINVHLYAAVKCGTHLATPCDPNGKYEIEADGSYKKGPEQPGSPYLSESWERPTGCAALDVYGNPVVQQAMPTDPTAECVEAPMSGTQFGPMNDPDYPEDGFGATVDGNFGFGGIPAGDYLVEVEIPVDPILGRPLYKVTREEDINVFNGDAYVPQVPPPACVGPLHTVDVAGIGPDSPDATSNPNFLAEGGSPYEGQLKPLCNMKLVRLQNGRSIAPGFNLFTDVPLPARFMGLTVDNLNLSIDSKSVMFGEVAGIPYTPVGIYDFRGHLLYTTESDPNGIWEVLMPSSLQINCPTPSGVCPNMFRFVGNDPGQPYHRNPNYNPQYQIITVPFEAWPGVINPADLAPMPIAATIGGETLDGARFNALAQCVLPATHPQLFAVNKPYVIDSGTITISGDAFGATQGAGSVTLDGVALPINAWANGAITVNIPATTAGGPHQLLVTANNGQSLINGLTLHVLADAYQPTVIEVGPGKTFDPVTSLLIDPITGLPYEHALQNALEAAANTTNALVVVYPNTAVSNTNPVGEYFENIIIHSPVKLQGVGPGGLRADGSVVGGSILDGIGYSPDATPSTDWFTLIGDLLDVDGNAPVGNPNISDGEVVYVLPTGTSQFGATYAAAIDGFSIQGGDQLGFPATAGFIGDVPTQGGGIYVHGYANYLHITNNVLQSNGGAYGGAIRVGTPEVENNNHNLRIAHNRFVANGGTNLAGAIGLFRDADGYEVAHNDFCGNYSSEYGGAISHFGLSPNGSIHDNRLYFNQSVDEGAGIMIAGELPTDSSANYETENGPQGAGAVDIYNNLIQSNIAGDDGGGLRFLMAGNFVYNVYNNIIANNISAHEGGGVAIDDASNIRFYNNTVIKNLTTDTAATAAFGTPYPAGLSTGDNSAQLQATLPGSAPAFSDPLMFNNIFWDNRAGSYNESTAHVEGIGLTDTIHPIDTIRYWDMGSTNSSIKLSPSNSILYGGSDQSNINSHPSNQPGVDPLMLAMYDTSVNVYPWRSPNQPAPVIIAVDQPGVLLGDYHLQNSSPAINLGVASQGGVSAPTTDIDGQPRPANCDYDSGADEVLEGGLCLMHIGDLDASFSNQDANNWQATVTMTLHTTSHSPVSGAVISGTWSAGSAGIVTCTTNASGQCSLSRSGFNKTTVPAVTFSVANVTHATQVIAYQASSNHDPDADSTGTAITLNLPAMHIGDLDASFSNQNAANWQAAVTITVHNTGHTPVVGAVVSGQWSAGSASTVTCTTNASGQCSLTRTGFSKATVPSVTFTILNVTHATQALTYQASANHDPDGDSTGTAITLNLPTMHVGDLDASFSNQNATNWQAAVTFTVHTSGHTPVVGAVVSGIWSAGGSGTVMCMTNASGQCSLTRSGFNKASVTSVTFTVSTVAHTTQALTYQASANHDPDGDSTGTAITITPAYMHVGDLDRTSLISSATLWQAVVTVTVHTTAHSVLANATVVGTWTNASGTVIGTSLCVTNGSGQCTVTRSGLSRTLASDASVTFTITSVTVSGNTLLYRPADNHDPDAPPQNSNGTAITAPKP